MIGAILVGGLAAAAAFLVLAMVRDGARRERSQVPVVLYSVPRKEDDDGAN